VLVERGVDRVAVSGDHDVPVQRMDHRYLYTYLAGDVGAYVAERSGATAACFFRTVGQLEERALLKLAESFRYLLLHVQRGGAAVCRALRRHYGLPVVETPTQSQLRGADFALVLHPLTAGTVLSERCLTFSPQNGDVPGGMPITGLNLDVPPSLAAEIPAGFQPEPVLSEAAFRGQIDPSKIKINSVSLDKTPESHYNTSDHRTGVR